MATPSDVRFEDLFAFRGWVRALARRLAADDFEADDLEQQVWIAAIERPPRHGGNLRAWLGAVTRNAARNLRRATGRRERHEAATAREGEVRTPADLAAEAESQRALVLAVLELDEPYRGTVLLRWFEGLTPTQVAGRQGVPVATVHTRLTRAHARLRERLDREFGGRAAWVPLLTGGAQTGPRPAGPRPAGGTATATGATATSTTIGGALMTGMLAKVTAAVAVIALAALVWRWGSSDDLAGGGPGAGGAGGSASMADAAKKPRRASAPVVPETGEALAGADRENDLAGIVVGPEGAPVRGADLTVVDYPWRATGLVAEEAFLLPRERATTKSRDDGTFAFRLRRGDSVSVRARAEGFATAEYVLRSAGERTRIVLSRAVGLDLLCANPDGSTVAGVRILAMTWPPDLEPHVAREGVSDSDGKLAWSDLPPKVKVHVLPVGWHEALEVELPAEGRIARTLPFGRGRTIEGVVVDAVSGRGIAGALVNSGPLPGMGVSAAQDGSFRLQDWLGRATDEIHCTATGYARGVVRPGESGRLTISLSRGVRISARLLGADGKAVEGALVTATAKLRDDANPRASSARATSDAEGRFVLADLAGDLTHRFVVSARGQARLARAVEPMTPPADIDLGDVTLAASRTIAGKLVASGDGMPRAAVLLRPAKDDGSGDRTVRRTDDQGRFRFEDLAPGRYVVSASGDAGASGERTVDLPADKDVTDVVLGDASGEGTRMLVVKVVDGDDHPVAGAMVTATSFPFAVLRGTTGAEGTVRLEAPRKRLQLGSQAPAGDRVWQQQSPEGYRQIDADATEVVLRLLAGVRLDGQLLGADGSPVEAAFVSAVLPGGRWANATTNEDGRFSMAVPLTGTFAVRWSGQRRIDSKKGVEIVDTREWAELESISPGTTGIVLRAQKVEEGLSIPVRVVAPDGTPVAGLGVWARDLAINNPEIVKATTGADGRAVLAGMPGRLHRIGTSPKDRLYASAWHEVRPGAPDEVTLTLRETVEIRGTITDADGRPFQHYESKGYKLTVNPYASNERTNSHYSGSATDAEGRFTILVPADDPGPFTVSFNLAPQGDTQMQSRVDNVQPGAGDVRLVMREHRLDE